MEKFDMTRQHDSKSTRLLRVWVYYNWVWVGFVSTRLTRLINGLFLGQPG